MEANKRLNHIIYFPRILFRSYFRLGGVTLEIIEFAMVPLKGTSTSWLATLGMTLRRISFAFVMFALEFFVAVFRVWFISVTLGTVQQLCCWTAAASHLE